MIRIGPFPSRETAKKFAQQLDGNTQIKPYATDNSYRVTAGEFPSRDQALLALEKLLPIEEDHLSASVAEINSDSSTPLSFRFGIIVRGPGTDTAEAYLAKLDESGLLPPGVEATIEEGAIIIQHISSWSAAVQLKRQLEQQIKQGQPFLLLWQEIE